MLAYTARYDAFGSGELPRASGGALPVDALDVADVESEAEHGYELGPARETENLALVYSDEGEEIADGARVGRTYDRFVLRGRVGGAYRLVARFVASQRVALAVQIATERLAELSIAPSGWTEASIDVPENLAGEAMQISVLDTTGAGFGSAHYWLYPR
jgi:hypothetical protein